MTESKTLRTLWRLGQDEEIFARLTGKKWTKINIIRAIGPNDDFPLPWVIEKFDNLPTCSIVSRGIVNNTIISIIPIKEAEKILNEISNT